MCSNPSAVFAGSWGLPIVYRCTGELIMPLRTWEHFGGLDGQQQGYLPAESDLKQWAQAFCPVQAQALLCNGDVYPPSYRETLTISKELMSSAVQRYNRQNKAMPAGPDLGTLQARVSLLEDRGFTGDALKKLLQSHPTTLQYSIGRIDGTLETLAMLIQEPVGSQALQKVILAGHNWLFSISSETLFQRLSHLTSLGCSTNGLKAAIRCGVYAVPVEVMQARTKYLMQRFALNSDQLLQCLNSAPDVLTIHSATLDSHALAMQRALNLEELAVVELYLRQPKLINNNMNSTVFLFKLEFLFGVMQVTVDMLLECPILLMASLGKRMGPRFSFLLSLVAQDEITMDSLPGLFCFMAKCSNVLFANKFNRSHLGLLYDGAFQDRWVERWSYLTRQRDLSVQEIGRHPEMLVEPYDN